MELRPERSLHSSPPFPGRVNPHGYPGLWAENTLEDIVANGFAIGMIQADSEALEFAAFIRDEIRPSNVLELGTLCGGWMYVMDRMAQPGLRISVDRPWAERDPKPRWAPDLFHSQVKGVVEITGEIHDATTFEEVGRVLSGRQVDLLYVDADHGYAGTKRHVEMYSPFVRPGGYVALHDVANGWPCGIYYEQLARERWHREFVGPENARFGVGVLRV